MEKKGRYPVKPCGRARIYNYAKIYELIDKGVSSGEIAIEVGCPPSSIYKIRSLYRGKNARKKKGNDDLDYSKVEKLYYETKMSDARIAQEVGCSSTTVFKWRKRNGLPCQSEKLRLRYSSSRTYRNIKISTFGGVEA